VVFPAGKQVHVGLGGVEFEAPADADGAKLGRLHLDDERDHPHGRIGEA